MRSLKGILNSFRLKRIRSKILVFFFFIAIIFTLISVYSIFQLDSIGKNVDSMEAELDDIQSGIETISTFGLNISDVHAKIGVIINKMHHCIHMYEKGDRDAKELFQDYKANFTRLIQKLESEINDRYGSLQVDIAHIKSNFNQYILTIENQDNQGIFDEIKSLNDLKTQLKNKVENISPSNINSISLLTQQIAEKENRISKMFQTITKYETKINAQLDSLIENLYFEIDKINENANQSNQIALQTRDSIESEISKYKIQLVGISLFLIIFVGIIGYYYSKKITYALQQLTVAAKKMQKGIFPSQEISVDSDDEFRLLTDAFNSMTASIKRLIKQKNEFINQLGHDLKNPLGPLINLLPIIDKHTTNPKDKEILQVIQRNVNYMKNLVQKTLELARLNAPNTKLSIEKINLKGEVRDIINQNKFMFKQKQITVNEHIPEHIIVSADQIRLEELFNNLFNNSVKYNLKAGSIIINAVEKKDDILVSIKDSGIGMTKEQLKQIFDEFYKADESRHDFDSSGLGMAICKSIVKKHGGQIWAESEGTNKGSTFYFTIPKENDFEPIQPELQNQVEYQDSSIPISERVDKLLMEKE